jgi:hypothetical protein
MKIDILSRLALTLLSTFFLVSCLNLETRFQIENLLEKTYKNNGFEIFTLQKISNPKKPLRIYIEGDGFSYVKKYRPSINPTPRSSFLFELIAQDNAENLIYIARPCQYVQSKKCEEKYWTNERFSGEVISAISAVVDEFKDYEIELVAYSGGAMIALQLQQENIKNIRTIAGNLDLEEFTRIHKISSLETTKINYDRLSKIPQIHFVGGEDKIIPLEIFVKYQSKLSQKKCLKMKIVDGATHSKNWQEWKELLTTKPDCR